MFELWFYKIFMGILVCPPTNCCETFLPEDATLPEYFRFKSSHVAVEGEDNI